MTKKLYLEAEIRTDVGKGASRRLRHANKVPAIIYGADREAQAITLDHNRVIKALEDEDCYTQILTLKVGSNTEQVVLKDMQRHVYKPKITHMDFLRVKADEELTMLIPIHFLGEEDSPGAKAGGTISHHISEVEIRCLPADLPKAIELDVAKMELDDTLHLSDLILPKGVALTTSITEGHDQPVVSIHLAKIAEAPEPTAEAEAASEVEAAKSETAEANKE